MPNTTITHGSIADMQVETNLQTRLLVVQARGGQKLSPAGMIAATGALNTYYGSTLSTAQKAALPDWLFQVAAGNITAYAAPGAEATLAAALIAAIGTNTTRG